MTINTIAKMAGVSPATVSRYLNQGYVSEEKKERIRNVIEQTGYSPSPSAQMLRTGKNHLVGVIVPRINSEPVAEMVEGITRIMAQAGYQILLANTSNQVEKELEFPHQQCGRCHLYGHADVQTPSHCDAFLSKTDCSVGTAGRNYSKRLF